MARRMGNSATVVDILLGYSEDGPDVGLGKPCRDWVRSKDSWGYGAYRRQPHRNRCAHVVSYETFVGPVPDGTELDHLCHRTQCIEPTHLEPVPPIVNTHRRTAHTLATRTHCGNGHEWSEANTYWWNGRRYCRECRQQHR